MEYNLIRIDQIPNGTVTLDSPIMFGNGEIIEKTTVAELFNLLGEPTTAPIRPDLIDVQLTVLSANLETFLSSLAVTIEPNTFAFLRFSIIKNGSILLSTFAIPLPSGVYPSLGNEITFEQLILVNEKAYNTNASANTVVYTFFDIEEINASDPSIDFSDEDLEYIVILNGLPYLFIGVNGFYGVEDLQIELTDLDLLTTGAGVETLSGNLVDNTDPNNPIVNGLADVIAGTNITIDKTDPANPVISADGGGGTPTLQQVLDEGNTADQSITLDDGFFRSRLFSDALIIDIPDEGYALNITANNIIFGNGENRTLIQIETPTGNGVFEIPNLVNNTEIAATREWVTANAPSGAVDSVNGQTGVVVLDATDVGAEPALAFTPEDVANKTTDITDVAGTYPDTPTVKNYIDLDENLFAIKSNFIGLLQIPAISGASNIGNTASGTNNRVIFQPFRVGKPITINTISLMQNAANDGADANLTVYIFDNSNDGFPGNKLLQSVSANGIFIGTQKQISFSVNVTLPRGNYWIGIHARDLNTIGGNPTFLGGVITTNSVIGSTINYSNNNNSQLIITTQPTDLGDNPATTISLNANINFPQIFIKLT